MLGLTNLVDIDDGGHDMGINPVHMIGQHAAPVVAASTVARRGLQL